MATIVARAPDLSLMRRLALATAAATAGALAVAAVASRRREPGGAATHLRRSRSSRNAQLAGVGTRLGAATAANRARRVFALSAERRQQLDAELELATASEVAAALGNMKGA